MKNIKKYTFFSVLALLLFSTPGGAFEDTVERYYNSDPASMWDISTYTNNGGTQSVSVVQYPEENLNTVLKLYISNSHNTVHTTSYAKIKSLDSISQQYFAYTVCNGSSIWAEYPTNRDIHVEISYYSKDTDALLFSLVTGATPGKYEIVKSSSTAFTVYSNGVQYTTISNNIPSYTGDVYVSIDVEMNSIYISATSALLYIDDLTDSSCLGVSPELNDVDINVAFTWSEQLLRNYPDAEHKIQLTCLSGDNTGDIKSWIVPENNTGGGDEWGYIVFDRLDVLGTNFGLYMLELSRDDIALANTYFYYYEVSNLVDYPDTLFTGSGTASMEISSPVCSGGEIESGESIYLVPEDVTGGIFPFTFNLNEESYSFTTNIETVYGNEYVNATPITFEGLQNNYQVTLDGEEFPPGAAASGSFTFTGNLTDGDTLNISADRYEFDSDSNTTNNTIPVPLDLSNLSISTGNLLEKIQTNGTADVSAELTISEGAGGGSGATGPAGFNYTAEITITDPSDQEGYQAAFYISQLDGMQEDGEDIKFYAENGTKLNYWVDSENTVNGSYYVGYVATPADATSINLYYGNGSAVSESNGTAVFGLFDDCSDTSKWTLGTPLSGGTGSLSSVDGELILECTSTGGINYIMNSAIPDGEHIISYRQTSQSSSNTNAQTRLQLVTTSTADPGTTNGAYSKQVDNSVNFGINEAYTSTPKTFAFSTPQIWEFSTGANAQLFIDGDLVISGTNADPNYIGKHIQLFAYSYGKLSIDWIIIRQYEATEPTLSIGTPEPISTTTTAKLSLTANTIGTAGNLIPISTNATNITASGSYLTGGIDSIGYTNGATTWSYNITDWTTATEHIFEFSPDLTKSGIYGYVKDPDTYGALRTATITISNDTVSYVLWTDSNGMYYKTTELEAGQKYTVKAAKSGYVTFEGTAMTTEGATTKNDIYLSQEDLTGVYYEQHDVGFQLLTRYGTTITNATVELYSENDSEYDIEAAQTGITDSSGKVVFEDLDKYTRYKLVFSNTEGTLYTAYEYPIFDFYTYCISGDAESIDSNSIFSNRVNYGIYASPTDTTTGTINVTVKNVEDLYSIPCTFNISSESGELLYNNSGTLGTTGDTGQYWNYSQEVPLNATYVVQLTISHPSYSSPRVITKIVNLNVGVDSRYSIFGWGDQWKYQVLVVIAVLMVSLLASRWDAHIIAAVVPFVGGLFMLIGWYGNSIMGLVMILYAILHYGIGALSKGGSRST